MANLKGTQAANAAYFPVPSADGATDPIPVVGDYSLTGAEANGDIIEIIPWPANTTLVDLYVDTEDLGTTFTADVGVMSGAWGDSGVRTCGAEFMTAKAFGTVGIYRADVAGFSRLGSSTTERSIGIKGTTIGTPTAAAKVTVVAVFRPITDGR